MTEKRWKTVIEGAVAGTLIASQPDTPQCDGRIAKVSDPDDRGALLVEYQIASAHNIAETQAYWQRYSVMLVLHAAVITGVLVAGGSIAEILAWFGIALCGTQMLLLVRSTEYAIGYLHLAKRFEEALDAGKPLTAMAEISKKFRGLAWVRIRYVAIILIGVLLALYVVMLRPAWFGIKDWPPTSGKSVAGHKT